MLNYFFLHVEDTFSSFNYAGLNLSRNVNEVNDFFLHETHHTLPEIFSRE